MFALRFLAVLPVALALAACGEEDAATGVASASTRPPPHRLTTPLPRHAAPPAAHVLALPGLQGVIGATGAELTRQFGPARLDVIEGDARKLQFSGAPCVLDVYLYPGATGREPQATYVDARRMTDGRDVDRAACVAALRKSP
jgi:hypothetical protein